MEFGIVLPLTADYATWETLLAITREAERLGYDSVWVSDHFQSPRRAYSLEAWTVLSALAASTERLRLGTYVLCNQFRHPALVAKMASTLDHLSKGRLDLGLGAGWDRAEHVAFGLRWATHSTRIERLREAATLLTKLWTEDDVWYAGRHYRLEGATLEPKPHQTPHPPLWLGGRSPPIKQLVAERGDGWIPVLPTPEQLAAGVKEIAEAMRRGGRDPSGLRVAYGGSNCLLVASTAAAVEAAVPALARTLGRPRDALPGLIGTPEQCLEQIVRYQEAGAHQIVAGFSDFPSFRGMRLLAETVLPCLH